VHSYGGIHNSLFLSHKDLRIYGFLPIPLIL
jgi:hypothetical protein